MAEYDLELIELVNQFENMSRSDRQAVLRKLPVKHRIRLKRVMSGNSGHSSTTSTAYQESNMKTLEHSDFSDWMLAIVDNRKRPEMLGLRQDFKIAPLTARTLSRLIGHEPVEALSEAAANGPGQSPNTENMMGTPSLIEKIGGLFAKKLSKL